MYAYKEIFVNCIYEEEDVIVWDAGLSVRPRIRLLNTTSNWEYQGIFKSLGLGTGVMVCIWYELQCLRTVNYLCVVFTSK